MKKRTKISLVAMSLCLVIALGVLGIFAVKTLNMSIGGNITFTADGILASISKGTMAGGSFVTPTDADTKMQAVEVTTNKTETELNAELASWQGLNLAFAQSGADVTITFTIKNNSTQANSYIDVKTTINNGTAVNAYADVSPSWVVIDPGATQTFVVTLSVITTEINASLTDFVVGFALSKTNTKTQTTNLSFDVGEAGDAANFPTTSYEVGSVIETLSAPTIKNKTFEGWYTDAACTQKVEFPFTITADTKLYAKFTSGTLAAASYKYDAASDSYHIVRNTTAGYVWPEIIIVPDMYEGPNGTKPVTKITDGSSGSTIPLGNNTTTKEIYLGNNITYIGAMAFRQATALEKIYMTNSVLEMSTVGFQFTNCTSLKDVTLSNKIPEIPYGAFYNTAITNIDFVPASVTKTGQQAFSTCNSLVEITIPKTLTEIGSYLFAFSENLTTVNLHSKMNVNGGHPFFETPYYANNKNQIVSYYDIPSSKVLIAADSSVTDTTQIPGYESITHISPCAFINISLEQGTIVDNTTLKNVNFPNVKEVGGRAFYMCNALTSVDLPMAKTIGIGAFAYSKNITSVNVPEADVVGEAAFQHCENLQTITMPKVKYVEPYAFCYAYKLNINLHEGLIWLGDQAIGHNQYATNTSITIPSTLVQIGGEEYVGANNDNNIIGCQFYNTATNYLSQFVVAQGNPYFVTHEGVLYTKNYKYMVSYPSAKQGETYTIPEGCINAFVSGFSRAHYLKILTVPNTFEFRRVNNLDNNFYADNININNMSIAFYNYVSINEIVIKSDNPNYKSVDGVVYSKDGKELFFVPTAKARGEVLTLSGTCETITTIPFYYKDTSTLSHNGITLGARPSEIVIGANVKTISQAALDAINSYTWTITSNSPYYTVNSEGKLVKA